MNDARFFDGSICVSNMCKKLEDLKGKLKTHIKNGKEVLIEHELKMMAQNASGFHSGKDLNNFSSQENCK